MSLLPRPDPARRDAVASRRPPGPERVSARVHSRDLLRDGQLLIEHAGREYRLRITRHGKLILTA